MGIFFGRPRLFLAPKGLRKVAGDLIPGQRVPSSHAPWRGAGHATYITENRYSSFPRPSRAHGCGCVSIRWSNHRLFSTTPSGFAFDSYPPHPRRQHHRYQRQHDQQHAHFGL